MPLFVNTTLFHMNCFWNKALECCLKVPSSLNTWIELRSLSGNDWRYPGCVPIPVLPWVHLKEVHYLHYPYSLEYANFSDVSAVPNRVLCGALTGNDDDDCRRGSSPAINIPLWTVNSLRLAAIKSYQNYKMTINAGYVENAPTLAQPGSASSAT